MNNYKLTIGLEVHAELKTKSKMFCGCENSPEEVYTVSGEGGRANLYTCPVCMGHPGTLPVINKEAVRKVLLVGTAVGADIADFTEFDRKNYFYPDIPKGYQISQYKYPLVSGGQIAGVNLTRIHLEEDTARSSHDVGDGSLLDFNRAGVPLLELVTEPVMHSGVEAVNFAKELQLLLQYLDVSGANMEKGEMRVEANISVSKTSSFGTKVEVKNINSFRAVGKAIEFEFKRQTDLLENGGKVVQETRGWDENREVTFSQRLKESAHDYKYFPDPDLPKLIISEIPDFKKAKLEESLVELPSQKRLRYEKKFGLKIEDIETYINNLGAAKFLESLLENREGVKKEWIRLASNYIISDIMGSSKAVGQNFTSGKIEPKNFIKLIDLIYEGVISSRGAKDTLKVMFEFGGDPEVIIKERGLTQKNNPDEIRTIVENIIKNNPDVVKDYKSGKESVLQFLVGQGMKETKGSANPEMLKKIILEFLS